MPPEAEFFFAWGFVITVGAFLLTGYRMRLGARERMARTDHDELDRLNDAVEDLTIRVRALAQDHADLIERMDFAERLLADPERADAATPIQERTACPLMSFR